MESKDIIFKFRWEQIIRVFIKVENNKLYINNELVNIDLNNPIWINTFGYTTLTDDQVPPQLAKFMVIIDQFLGNSELNTDWYEKLLCHFHPCMFGLFCLILYKLMYDKFPELDFLFEPNSIILETTGEIINLTDNDNDANIIYNNLLSFLNKVKL